MPLYEWHCRVCDLTFEALVAASVSKRRRACPLCRRLSGRVMSAALFHSGKTAPPLDARPAGAKSDVTELKVPSAARICWMDDRSASRLVAYKRGRGAEYDDTMATREEVKKKYGVKGKPSSHAHGHSLLADPAVMVKRAAAARKSAGKPPPAP
jgi:putative FmdB family regulatory protein